MEYCLFKKLKGSTNNVNLDRLGYFQVRFDMSNLPEGASIFIRTPNVDDGILENGTYNGNNTIPGETTVQISDIVCTDDILIVSVPKYNWIYYQITGGIFDAENLLYTQEDLQAVSFGQCKISSAEFLNIVTAYNLNVLRLSSCVLTGEFDVTNVGTHGIVTLDFGGTSTGLKGSLDKVGLTASTLTSFFVPGTKSVSLSIENYVANARSAGVTSKSDFDIRWLGSCNATFNGEEVVNQSHNYLSWTATTITLNGTTITA